MNFLSIFYFLKQFLSENQEQLDSLTSSVDHHGNNNTTDHQTVIIIQPDGQEVTDEFTQSILQGTITLASDDGQTTVLTAEEASQLLKGGILPSVLSTEQPPKPAPNPPAPGINLTLLAFTLTYPFRASEEAGRQHFSNFLFELFTLETF